MWEFKIELVGVFRISAWELNVETTGDYGVWT